MCHIIVNYIQEVHKHIWKGNSLPTQFILAAIILNILPMSQTSNPVIDSRKFKLVDNTSHSNKYCNFIIPCMKSVYSKHC